MSTDLTPMQRLEARIEEFERSSFLDLALFSSALYSLAAESAAMKQEGARYSVCETRDMSFATLLRRFKKSFPSFLDAKIDELKSEKDVEGFHAFLYEVRDIFEQTKGHLLPHVEDFPRSVEALNRLEEDLESAYVASLKTVHPEKEAPTIEEGEKKSLSKGMKIALAVGSFLLAAGLVFLIFYFTK